MFKFVLPSIKNHIPDKNNHNNDSWKFESISIITISIYKKKVEPIQDFMVYSKKDTHVF